MKGIIRRRLLFVLTLTLFYFFLSFAHSGWTDKYGGHHDRKNGGYHYHNSGDEDSNAGTVVVWILVGLLFIGLIANAGNKKDK